MNIIRVGVDIAKSVFHVHGVDRHGHTQWQGKYSRSKWLDAGFDPVRVRKAKGLRPPEAPSRYARAWLKQEFVDATKRSSRRAEQLAAGLSGRGSA